MKGGLNLVHRLPMSVVAREGGPNRTAQRAERRPLRASLFRYALGASTMRIFTPTLALPRPRDKGEEIWSFSIETGIVD